MKQLRMLVPMIVVTFGPLTVSAYTDLCFTEVSCDAEYQWECDDCGPLNGIGCGVMTFGVDINETHFLEVGALDSMVDETENEHICYYVVFCRGTEGFPCPGGGYECTVPWGAEPIKYSHYYEVIDYC